MQIMNFGRILDLTIKRLETFDYDCTYILMSAAVDQLKIQYIM